MTNENPDFENDDDEDNLRGEEKARAHLAAGFPAYGQTYGHGAYSELQRAIWRESADALLYSVTCWERRLRRWIRRNFITGERFFELYQAICFANAGGRVMNAELTINFGCLDIVGDDEIFETFHIWTGRLRAWLSYRDIAEVHIYVFERPGKKSLHVHLQMHIPREHHAAFAKWAHTSVQSLAKPGAIFACTQPCLNLRGKPSIDRQWFWFRYMVKGLDPSIGLGRNWAGPSKKLPEQAGIDVIPQGEIGRQRARASHAISIKERTLACRRGDFVPPRLDGLSTKADFWTDKHFERSREKRVFIATTRALDDIL